MGSGTDVAMHAAGVTLMRGAGTGGRRHRHLAAHDPAFGYNVIGIPLAALGLLDPAIAGMAMALSSVSVVSNTLLQRRWHPTLEG